MIPSSDVNSPTATLALPEDAEERLAFIFCILVDIDNQTISLNLFLKTFFEEDDGYPRAFARFCNAVIRPWKALVVEALLPLPSFPSAQSGVSSSDDFTEKTIRKNYVYQGKILSVRCDDALLPDGKPCTREIVEHPGGTSVLYVENGKVLLVKQFRYAFGESIYELPAGKLNAGENPMEAAKRELSEEAGIEAETLSPICVYYPTCGYSAEKIYLYFAEKAGHGAAHLDEGEFLNAEYIPLERVYDMINSGEIKDSKTIIAVQWYLLRKLNVK
ncbi:MAG: NUDIX hydrolase [Clostridia bacterium]|nr:NUDIX hydrolase [Clostridia bacterium]